MTLKEHSQWERSTMLVFITLPQNQIKEDLDCFLFENTMQMNRLHAIP